MKHAATTLSLSLALCAGLPAFAQTPQTVSTPTLATSLSTSSPYAKFVPNPTRSVKLDYTVWDEMLKEMVYYTGPSLRQRATKPNSTVGTRFVRGHTSPYRLEGNKVVFETIKSEALEIINDYTADLIEIGNQIDIATLPKQEQLAYWLNLHNALVIQAIAKDYPVKKPSLETDEYGRAFHDIPRATIEGVPLSLRNIREDIVYQNWSNPLVIYGFFHGDIGSPSIQRKAYTGDNVINTLRFSGEEFSNSLRGVMFYGKTVKISKHYAEAAPYFFPNLDAGYRAHMKDMASEVVAEKLVKATNPVEVASYELAVADLTNGDSERITLVNVETNNENGTFGPSSPIARALTEQNEKFQRIRKRGLFGTVTIEDVETVDPADFGTPRGPSTINIGPLAGSDDVQPDTADE